ncbi:Integrator complex subunit 4 [Astathelohania contejeani]|uniref:Integrator complex subunit 4 n=1 Tax=Astathelohania contejeani TaxID=164912 RepID=A0ABQ7HXS0_9MICR|nr:Integrator complex subunit 4 [Thelohania contejeani]
MQSNIHNCLSHNKLDMDVITGNVRNIDEYLTCNLHCNELIIVDYLNYFVVHKIEIPMKEEYLKHENSRIRKLAYKLWKNKSKKEVINDPSCMIQAISIKESKNIELLLKHTYMKQTKLAALCKLTEPNFLKNIQQHQKHKIFNRVCKMITDSSLNIRITVAKALKNFTGLKKEIIMRALNKGKTNSSNGAIVYGLDDENHLVRINTIISLFHLTIYDDIVGAASEFLIDSLNDEIEEVRKVASLYLKQLTTKYRLIISPTMLKLIICSLSDTNLDVKYNLYDVIANTRHEESSIAQALNSFQQELKRDINFKKVLEKISRLAENNIEVLEKLEEFAFSKANTLIIEREPSIGDKHYLAKLVVIRELIKYRDIEIPKYMKNHFLYLEIKKSSSDTIKFENEGIFYEFLKENINHILDKISEIFKVNEIVKNREYLLKYVNNYKSLFNNPKTDTHLFYCYLYNAIKHFIYGNIIPLNLINYMFDYGNNNYNFEKEDGGIILDNIKTNINQKDFSVRYLWYIFNVPSTIICLNKMPIQFTVRILKIHCSKDIYFRINEKGKNIFSYYLISNSFKIVLNEKNLSEIETAIVRKTEMGDVLLSVKKTIQIN